ncbi:hypothetical protein BDK51DRAFT_40286 [Blyttiomyces helicus]|uniref:Protein kinase domain-containing protein n=1 Tax=Blyttiomyces helicus TaxID=388810 RepID=A0A4P9W2L7_9FUNG|nr:hypothetical protein BDK51DRAFT_40286 [Blyttiomyces helicus]|eukprot:RKO86499.1 hypothetical protein BDK51DRAFT_40286 [Blyttiomyces helicus]
MCCYALVFASKRTAIDTGSHGLYPLPPLFFEGDIYATSTSRPTSPTPFDPGAPQSPPRSIPPTYHSALLGPTTRRASSSIHINTEPVKETHVMVQDYDPETGNKRINKYMIVKELGRGCHGKVKLCVDVETGQEWVSVFIKGRERVGLRGGSISVGVGHKLESAIEAG